MSSSVPADQLGKAVLNAVQNGTYPDSEEIISANFSPSAFPQALELFNGARDEVKARVRKSSKNSAQDIDGWISQAKQLRRDIEVARRSSADILAKAKQDAELKQKVHDGRSKLRLLDEEIAFNQDLAATLEQVQNTRHATGQVQDFLDQGDLLKAVELSLQIDSELKSVQSRLNVNAIAVLQHESRELRHQIARAFIQSWHDAIRIDAQTCTVFIPYDVEALSTLASALQGIGLLDGLISDLADGLENALVVPRLHLQANMHDLSLIVEGDTIRLSGASSPADMHRLFSDMATFLSFLQTHLPPSIFDSLSKVCGLNLAENLISTRLSSAVPEELAALRAFNITRAEVYRFSETLSSHGWLGANQLRAWTNNIPQVWLEKRQRKSLDQMRLLLKRGFGDIKTVERVETQTVSQQDHLFPGNTGNDDWNAGWSDEETGSPVKNDVKHQNEAGDDEEDVSAWGLDEEDDEQTSKDAAPSATNDDEADAWGWGDDENKKEDPRNPQRKPAEPSNHGINRHVKPRRGSQREVTLRETYNITSLPIGVFNIISSILSDVDALGEQSNFHMTPAIPGLSNLPSLLLVMLRASASNFYPLNNSGNMFLYNDCLWLVDQLLQNMQTRAQDSMEPSTSRRPHIRFDDDISALEAFGKRSYGKEMESQRTIVKDLLDGAQGFANCTEPPFSQECDLAVSSIVDRLRGTHRQWKDVLSYSALVQSIGSLLSTVIDKIIIDVEDMSDISEPESQRLTAYCKQVIALEDLFLPQESASNGQELVPPTATYAPGWIKFQYLSEILDSSLVDIKYLWTDGGLKLEYEVEEVVELIEALFADSEHRRRAIGEIRRSSGR